MTADIVLSCEPIVDRETSAVENPRRPSIHGHEKRLRRHQVRSQMEERGALAQRFAHQMNLQLLEIAKAAMNQLRVLAAGSGSEMALLDQRYAYSAHREIAGDARAIDAATQNENVEPLTAEAVQVADTALAVQCGLTDLLISK